MILNRNKKKTIADKKEVEKNLHIAAMQDESLIISRLKTTSEGLTEEQVLENREVHGNNKVTEHKKDSVFKRLFESFVNPFSGF